MQGASWLAIGFAPFAGSFLGVIIRRLPAGRPIAFARSHCETCGHPLAAIDLLPLVGFLWLGGHCRYCRSPIGLFAPAVEVLTTGVAIGAAWADPEPVRLWIGCVFGWALLVLGWIDLQTMTLPNAITLPLVLGGLAATAWLAPETVPEHALAAACGYLALRGLAIAFRWLRGQEGLGGGDAKLLAACGAWLGPIALPWVVCGAAMIGLTAAFTARLAGRPVGRATRLPFGPPLALAAWIAWLYGS